ncbi:hypothetical protein IGI04_002186, partial [Brassica rapa subsp. trilocularis]
NDELRNGVTKDAFIRIKQEYSGVEPTPLAAKPTKLVKLAGLRPGCNPSPTMSPPPSPLVSVATVSVDLWVSLRDEGENASGSGSETPRSVARPRRWARRGVRSGQTERLDWESRLPCVLGPCKSRLSLFTRKQQKLLNKAREMEGVPDLSALLKGRLQLLSKKSAPVDPSETTDSGGVGAFGDRGVSKEGASNSNDEGISVEPSAPSPKKKKKDKKTTEKPAGETSPLLSASLATSSEGQGTKKKKKKRTRDEATSRDEGTAMDDAIPVERPKKKTKKKAAGTEPGSSVVVPTPIGAVREDDATPNAPLEKKRKALAQRSGYGSESAGGEKSVPGSSTSRGPRLEGSLPKKGRVEYPDRVEFLYDEKTPLILNPLRCAELTRQIRGGTKELPQLEDLFFRDEYIDVATLRARSDGSMNFLVERYDTTLKQTIAQLGAADKLAATRLKVIERVRAELKQGNEKAAKEKEVLRVKFEELENKLKADRAAKKELSVHRESREKEGLEEIPEKGSPIAGEGIERVGVEDPVVVSDSSSGDQDGEGDDDAGEISRLRPSEEEKTDDVVEGEAVSSPPGVDLLASTRPEETVTPIAENPAEPFGSFRSCCIFVLRSRLNEYSNFENKELILRVEGSFVRFLSDDRIAG